ncbi:sulfite exporter TauE/SafE family protein [Halorubrum sp. SP3]|uniref:sulfite exporter TauE/SafE family protein n=1 Tax=unclassified Halorubrum TaxID=2642239 RepID=UPI0010F64190|nr:MULTISPECIES: sulfite exporter TauE/SafE family protein [unclassified Halorubrum]TKX53604.1 sulfite exporter TauE/SafE family protein [Halorubrum sp. SP3]TKX69493.1 sulfite exporter TauE/SafE family protein [Halorubrum sp. SP9]
MLGSLLSGAGFLGTSPEMLALFVGFGLVVGVLFGFFGMGGSFLVTPALLMLEYPAPVAVGSGMAFVFGTAVIATLKHHDLGQVDYKLGAIMITGTTIGIEVGRASVYYLESMGLAGGVISVAYVVLLGGVGAMVTRDALKGDGEGGIDHEATDRDLDEYEIPEIAEKIQRTVRIPPMVTLRGDVRVSAWVITAVAFATGVLSGFLGVGGGFIRMPAMIYAIGVPVPVAVGTDLFEIVFSGGLGSYLYGQGGGVNLGIVAPLLFGSALGARVGSAATAVVDADEIKVYFGGMLLVGSVAVGIGEVGSYLGNATLELLGLVLVIGAAVVVAFGVLYAAITSLRVTRRRRTSTAD